jgi:hypothetical protein
MINIKVAVCGAYYAGRHAMLDSVAKHIQSDKGVFSYISEYIPYLSLEGQYESYKLSFHAIDGNVLQRSKAIPQIFKGSNIIVYIISTILHDKYFIPTEEQQIDSLRLYISLAKENNVFMPKVPWVWVINKIDLTSNFPLGNLLPQNLKDSSIRCNFINDIGTQELINTITSKFNMMKH